MNWNISHPAEEGFICVEAEGELTAISAELLAKEISGTIEKYECNSLLVDHLKTVLRLSTFEMYQLVGSLDDLGIPITTKLAEVVPHESLADFKFLETLSKNRGYQMMVFEDMDSAKRWLKA